MQCQLFQKSYILEKANFSEKQFSAVYTYFFWKATFLERLLFQKTLPSIAAAFLEELVFITYFFRIVTISQLQFLSTATLLTYSVLIK